MPVADWTALVAVLSIRSGQGQSACAQRVRSTLSDQAAELMPTVVEIDDLLCGKTAKDEIINCFADLTVEDRARTSAYVRACVRACVWYNINIL